MRELRALSSADEVAAFETDVLAGFVLARASAGLADSTIRNDTGHLDRCRPAGERGPHAGPGRRAVGAGPVRQAERPPRQGIAQEGAEAAAGAADQRRR